MKRLLIEEWLPIAALGIEGLRERTPMTPFPAPNRLHVWFARRPLVTSRAAILASLLPADADRESFLRVLGIHGDPVAAKIRIAQATHDDVRLGARAYGYPRAFTYTPTSHDLDGIGKAVLLDPTAGGGSVPFEGVRLGLNVFANDLNPVAAMVLKATVEFPLRYGSSVLARYTEFGQRFAESVKAKIRCLFPDEPNGWICDGYLWARTVTCPYCRGVVPLSPNWALDAKGTGVRLMPNVSNRRCTFEIVQTTIEHSKATVKGGVGKCPFPDCGRVVDSDEIKSQAQSGSMGQQLYAIVYRYEKVVGQTKAGKPKIKRERGFRVPRVEDDIEPLVAMKLREKMPEWQARNIIPHEEIPFGYETVIRWPLDKYGLRHWTQMFSPRQLYCHCTSVEMFQEFLESIGSPSELDRAAMAYLALAIDKVLNYNCRSVRWIPQREVVAGQFDRHDFSFKWSHAEMAPTVTGLGYDWAVEQTGEALRELIELLGSGEQPSFDRPSPSGCAEVRCGSADAMPMANSSVDCIVMDPPYYNNVTYSELSDFFYVWLKRTAGLLYPELFADPLTNKDREAVANPARFAGQKGALDLAGADYEQRMGSIFAECSRVLKPGGVMTVMFTHKATGAWDALAGGLIQAGFTITASWPVNTEAAGSLHIRERSAAKSTIFLVCRARETRPRNEEPRYWEDLEPTVREAVRVKVKEFQDAGIGGIDLYLACFGPALQVFTEAWPLTRGTARPQPRRKQKGLFEEFDPYAVRPEDALEAARREVKRWRMEQLATVQRQHHLDALTEWYVLAWDAFRAPRFPADEALKLARVVGLDFDQQVKNWVCEIKGEDVVLWDSITRHRNGKLPHLSEECMLDTLHWAAKTAREQNTGAAKSLIEEAHLIEDPTLLTALEAMLNVLPSAVPSSKKKPDLILTGAASDFQALERLRKLAFAETVPAPKIPEQLVIELADIGEGDDESAD
jgi:putative DNA methylase